MAKEPPIKEVEVTVKLRNNRLKERRVRLGLSGPQLCEKLGINYPAYNELEALRLSPFHIPRNKKRARKRVPGKLRERQAVFRPIVLRLAKFYRVSPWELFPPAVLDIDEPKMVKTMDIEDLKQLGVSGTSEQKQLPPPAMLETLEEWKLLEEVLPCLRTREEFVLTKRYGLRGEEEHSQAEVAEMLEVSSTCIRQLECRAIRKLQWRIMWNRRHAFTSAEKRWNADAQRAQEEAAEAESRRKADLQQLEARRQKQSLAVYEDKWGGTYHCSHCATQIRAFHTDKQKIMPYCPKCNPPRGMWGMQVETFVFTTDMILDVPFKNEEDLHAALRHAHYLPREEDEDEEKTHDEGGGSLRQADGSTAGSDAGGGSEQP